MSMEDLAKRAVASPHWRWMPGMRSVSQGGHSRRLDPPPNAKGLHPWWTWCQGECEEGLPDLEDPATVGCLLALVREAWGDPLICVAVDNTGCGWWVDGWADPRVSSKLHDTEAEALVAALEAAP